MCMSDRKEIYQKLRDNPKNVRFEELCRAAELFGFELKGGKGSHRTFVKKGVREMLNLQEVGGWAKPYQVR
ncbi:MAG: type II toxin-antitoxin system HicA family toxin [Methanotrichaceae archaeon]|nr:type II toxin-antitoxin system HicA family toxin [Methanotrichaceae archaeon]